MRKMIRTAVSLSVALALCGAFVPSAGHAFEGETHMVITSQAYARSVLAYGGDGSVFQALGLDRLNEEKPFVPFWAVAPSIYYDGRSIEEPSLTPFEMPQDQVQRKPTGYERCQFRRLAGALWFSGMVAESEHMLTWLMRGVTREDDITGMTSCGGYAPDTEPNGGVDPRLHVRVLNHFYDPVYDSALHDFGGTLGAKSVNWALGVQDSFAMPQQRDHDRLNHFTYADARDNQWMALTGRRRVGALPYSAEARQLDSRERLYRWATTFRALGDVVHLLQDGAQPQHVRNDGHSPHLYTEHRQAYEGYTNSRLFDDPGSSTVNDYVRGFFDRTRPLPPAPPLELGTYPKVMFATPLRFFTTRGAHDGAAVSPDGRHGLLDYANRGFFTAGTLPDEGNRYARPPVPVGTTSGYVASVAPCIFSAQISSYLPKCRHWLHQVPDTVAAYTDTFPQMWGTTDRFPQAPLVAESIYGKVSDVFGSRLEAHYAIGLEEFQNMANLAVPRAIGYTAGMIDYFFRGRITLSPPPDGLYAVVDQGKPHTVSGGVPLLDDGSGRTFGFTTIRVRAKNSTGDANGNLIEAGTGRTVRQAMAGEDETAGMLVAVVRYHRNPCYSRTLDGENVKEYALNGTIERTFVPAGCTQTRGDVPEISVSKPIYIDGDGDLPGVPPGSQSTCANVGNINTGATGTCENDSALLEFDFSDDAVPINATDVFIQVVYRGRLGDELDGIAVGARDISEPQYYTMWNNSDWMLRYTDWKRREDVPSPPGPDSSYAQPFDVRNAHVCFYRQLVGRLPMNNVLYPRQFVRVGVLAELGNVYMGGIGMRDGVYSAHTDELMPVIERQALMENGQGLRLDSMIYGRGTTLGTALSLLYSAWPNDSGYGFAKAAKLTPALETEAGVGIPAQVDTFFRSEDDPVCSNYFAGSGMKRQNFVERRRDADEVPVFSGGGPGAR